MTSAQKDGRISAAEAYRAGREVGAIARGPKPLLDCAACGGNVGAVNPEHGMHELCRALRERGLATPSLGRRCVDCGGLGRLPRGRSGPALFLEGSTPGEVRRAIEAWAPACGRCGGDGVEPGTRSRRTP